MELICVSSRWSYTSLLIKEGYQNECIHACMISQWCNWLLRSIWRKKRSVSRVWTPWHSTFVRNSRCGCGKCSFQNSVVIIPVRLFFIHQIPIRYVNDARVLETNRHRMDRVGCWLHVVPWRCYTKNFCVVVLLVPENCCFPDRWARMSVLRERQRGIQVRMNDSPSISAWKLDDACILGDPIYGTCVFGTPSYQYILKAHLFLKTKN